LAESRRDMLDRQTSPVELRRLVLSVLVRKEAYGVEIAAALAAHLAAVEEPEIPEGAVYPALRWLERHGLAVTHWVDVGEAAPRRRYYSLTPRGARAAARDELGKARPHPRPSTWAARP
jgi:DNA-binding PadR family transcriptional regulator